ncbi:hypothetical protein [Cohnella phaseoli]|uniref:Uncharacterized protein n=1 Tax=Cohnella phaseoli TaxID=456490 RepID=A0A3D9KRC3_9BACL|nr:hypothetical protein [Cohnella phaseoli]RED89263.1 hypothetical protein DFP98_101238 [Cohnella phaseoli]
MNAITIKSIGDCTLAEITGLWNVGFEQLHGLTIFRRSGAFDCVPFRRERSDRYLCVLGMAEAVRALPHCEANPAREDGRDVVRFMLGEVYGPYDAPIERMPHYLRSTNEAAMEALAEAGFEKVFEEYLMVLGFGAQSGRTPQ